MPIPSGAQISITNLKGVVTPSKRHRILVGNAEVIAVWNALEGYLTFPVPENASFVELTSIQFVLRNPGSEQMAPSITVKVMRWAPTSIEKVAVGSGIFICLCMFPLGPVPARQA